MNSKLYPFSKTAGPGILFASTAIGVSHLIQSTRAGADFGLWMLVFVIVASLLKYPFFEYGSRYANATQTSIIDGYKKLGKPILWMYLDLNHAIRPLQNDLRHCHKSPLDHRSKRSGSYH